MSWFLPSLRPCDNPNMCTKPRKIHEVVFFLAIYLISVGTGGHKPSLESFGADQFDDNHEEERRQEMSFFNWWSCSLCSGLIVGVTLIVYIQDNINWGVADIIFTRVMAFSLLIFVVGRPFCRYLAPVGSPLTPMLHFLVAAISKRNLPILQILLNCMKFLSLIAAMEDSCVTQTKSSCGLASFSCTSYYFEAFGSKMSLLCQHLCLPHGKGIKQLRYS